MHEKPLRSETMLSKQKKKKNLEETNTVPVPVKPVLVVELAEVVVTFVLKLGHTGLHGRHSPGQQLAG